MIVCVCFLNKIQIVLLPIVLPIAVYVYFVSYAAGKLYLGRIRSENGALIPLLGLLVTIPLSPIFFMVGIAQSIQDWTSK